MGKNSNPFEGMSDEELKQLRIVEQQMAAEGSSEAQDVVSRIDDQLGEG